ncbi:YihY/virulence factor BrkB family protein [Oscillospiraceae bacterium N12]|jgi:membrane protein|uniref:YihY/virulence factor BrkB family protein n=1 Tax=Jilunia laotingensis TaxID=2763675 RepID=A0A926IPQ8_9BACT|nr:YihY/virulence factor BrkB family protein [Jilunia laotingensis]MBC8593549.1 YihY/virulence factor BrkB family protein [Jilunia laotingensis]
MKMLSKRKNLVSSLIKIGKETIQGFIDDNVTRLSASLAYATLFSIIPFLSLLITFGVYLEFDLANQFYAQLDPIVGAKVIEALQSITENAEKTNISSFAAVVSLGVSIFGATTVFAEIQSALNTIWGIKAIPKRSWLKYIKNRLLSFSIILVFAFILLITFSITNIIVELSNRFMVNNPDVAESFVKVIGMIINIGVTVLIFTLIFKILPDAKIKSKDVIVGAIVTTVLLLAGQWGISLYIGIANVGTVYGAAAFMVVFVTWIYFSAIIIYTGAEFTKAWANEMGGKIFPDEYAVATRIIEIHED